MTIGLFYYLVFTVRFTDMVLEKSCGRCLERLQPGQELVTSGSGGEILHQECFVCAACFRPFPNGVYYDVSIHWSTTIAIISFMHLFAFLSYPSSLLN